MVRMSRRPQSVSKMFWRWLNRAFGWFMVYGIMFMVIVTIAIVLITGLLGG
jgi:hypothetical protein